MKNITTSIVYRIDCVIPEEIWQAFGHLPVYESEVEIATRGAVASGSNSYSSVCEWAEYASEIQGKACVKRFERMLDMFKRMLEQRP